MTPGSEGANRPVRTGIDPTRTDRLFRERRVTGRLEADTHGVRVKIGHSGRTVSCSRDVCGSRCAKDTWSQHAEKGCWSWSKASSCYHYPASRPEIQSPGRTWPLSHQHSTSSPLGSGETSHPLDFGSLKASPFAVHMAGPQDCQQEGE